jgi:hypothetical protein
MGNSASAENINFRSSSYWIARTTGECDRCHAETRLVALVLPPKHQSLELGGDIEADGFVSYRWETAEWSAFIFYVEYLPEKVRRRLQAASKGYRLAYSERAQRTYWANHCSTCGELMEDHDLFCEPDIAFLPTTPRRAAAVTLKRFDEVLQAGATGYACDPQFLDSMIAI